MKKILAILGTRPEAIKLAPVILELKKQPDLYQVIVCNTEQQKELSNQTLGFFGITADINLNIMRPNQSLPELQARLLTALNEVLKTTQPNAVIVQGDTMTVLCGALAAFYHKVPVFHVEAGLRSYDLFEPFPEEAIRQMVSRITDLHFAPTQMAVQALQAENIPHDKIYLTGNTVIDALNCLSDPIIQQAKVNLLNKRIVLDDKLVLCTVHRRENHGERLDDILAAIWALSEAYPDHQFVLPVHPNPNVKQKVHAELSGQENIILTDPLDYPELVCLMAHAKLILTDSGGIQEEAPSFGVPILVMRYETERMEGVQAGFAQLVGANTQKIIKSADQILKQSKQSSRLSAIKNPYGDGTSAKKIITLISHFWTNNK